MKLRFFFADADDKVQRADQRRVLAAWKRKKPWDDSTAAHGLRLVTVVDDAAGPVHIYLLLLLLEDGWIREESRRESVQFIVAEERWGGGTRKQKAAWIRALKAHYQAMPSNLADQLAGALDIPVHKLVKVPLGIGGPLPVSLQMGVSVGELLQYFG